MSKNMNDWFIVGKRGNKKKERENRGKNGNEPLVKSMSLDDDNLSLAAKKTGERSNRVSSLKETSIRSERGRVEKDRTEKESVKGAASSVPGSKKSPENSQHQRECEREDSKSPVRTQAEPKFTVVIRKRKNKTACTTSPTGSTVGKESDNRKETRRSRSRGERRKSVGSVPGSDQSEGSDDGSVRSLPAGECTKRETIPKSCASSGGTPQTSYADIARLTKDEENKKELPQALEDYPSLHGSDNSDGSDYGSDRSVPVGDVTPKDVIQKPYSSNGGTPLTSYADIARLASHEEKKEDKKEQPSEDFPELSSTVSTASHESSVELMPSSPKSDLSASTVKYASSNSAFPQLAVSSAPKTTSQGPTNVKTMSTVVSVSSTTGTTKGANGSNTPIPTTSCAVSRAPTPTLKAQLSSTSPASTTTVPCSSINSVNNSVGGGSFTSNLTKASSPLTTRVLNSQPTTLSNSEHVVDFGAAGVKFKPVVCSEEKNIPTDFSAVINGHLSHSDRMARKSDISGAKTGKSAFSVTVPQQNITDSGMGLCTEAVVFCGENFKEPPQLPSKDLEFEFGFDVNEALVDMNVKVPPDSPTVMKSTSNKKHSKNKVFPTPSKEPTRIHQHSSNHRHYHNPQGGRDEMHRHNQEKNNPQIATDVNESRDSKKPHSTTASLDSKVPRNSEMLPGKPEARGASSSSDRQQSNNYNKQHNNPRKSAQADQTVSSEGVQVVAAQVPQSPLNESYSNSAIITSYSPTSMSPSVPLHTGIPPAVSMFGMPGYIPASTTYPTRFPGHLPASGVVQLPTSHSAYESPPGQYAPTVYSRTPSAPVASSSSSDDHNFVPSGAALQPQNPVAAPVTSECPFNAPTVVGNATGRQSQAGLTAQGGYHKVPDACNPPYTDSESARNVGQAVDFNNVPGYYGNSKVVFDRPVNLAPYYLTPDSSLYTNANMEDLRSYLRGRTQACERLQGDEKSRILQIT
ncbi:unnamed protein product [Allacma fusca]|uniref:Uncharacterized protein n=1 Tax=Allacma fusca TaxID=39272 RepID=A0A8J2JLZ7_9HEXA|nr:unnamed protein product [Allacma fusca]